MDSGVSGGINSTSLGRNPTRTRSDDDRRELFKKNKEGYLLSSLACVLIFWDWTGRRCPRRAGRGICMGQGR